MGPYEGGQASIVFSAREIEVFGKTFNLRVSNVTPVKKGQLATSSAPNAWIRAWARTYQIQKCKHGYQPKIDLPQDLVDVQMGEAVEGDVRPGDGRIYLTDLLFLRESVTMVIFEMDSAGLGGRLLARGVVCVFEVHISTVVSCLIARDDRGK